MINVAENSFRSRLLSKDKQGSLEYLKTNLAEEKFKAVNEAYQKIKDTRGIS